jgi:hypothetical protein
MTIEEIKAFLAANKDDAEVKAFLAELSPEHELTSAEVETFLGTEDGKTILNPRIDQAVTKAVKTRDKAHADILENEIKKRLAVEVLKLNPQEEPWQKDLREMKENLENEKAERARDNLKRQLVEEAVKMGVNPFFIEDYVPPSIEVGKLFLQNIAKHDKDVSLKVTNELLASGYKPGQGNEKKTNGQKQDLTALSQAELIKLEMEGVLDSAIVE